MTASKTKLASPIWGDCVVSQFLMAKHYPATAIHWEIFTLYGPVLWTKEYEVWAKKLYAICFVHIKVAEQIYMP